MNRSPELNPLEPFELDQERESLLQKACKLEWVTIVFMCTVVVLMYLAAGSSQSMKTALLEDVLSLVPPIAFLIGARLSTRNPSRWFPYGYHRATLIAYLAASTALVGLGISALHSSAVSLAEGARPTMGLTSLAGHQIWSGWVMLAALAYSAIPPVFLGRAKSRIAEKLGDPTLKADAATNRADWLTGLAASIGVLGTGFGVWWLDATMALFISLDIVRDGITYLRHAVSTLMDRAPSSMDDPNVPHPVIEELRTFLTSKLDLEIAELRIRSIGLFCTGTVIVEPTDRYRPEQIAELAAKEFRVLHDLDVVIHEKALQDEPELEPALS